MDRMRLVNSVGDILLAIFLEDKAIPKSWIIKSFTTAGGGARRRYTINAIIKKTDIELDIYENEYLLTIKAAHSNLTSKSVRLERYEFATVYINLYISEAYKHKDFEKIWNTVERAFYKKFKKQKVVQEALLVA